MGTALLAMMRPNFHPADPFKVWTHDWFCTPFEERMAKGLFTQGMCVLFRKPVDIAELQERLNDFHCVGQHESMDDDDAPQTLVYDYAPESNGHLLVTPANAPWPDDMGDPDESPERFVAWSLGQYAPLAFPGCLERAGEQSWGWEDGGENVKEHTAHIRLLISYVLGVEDPNDHDDDVPLLPEDYDPLKELHFLSKAVASLLDMPDAICYFNPGGEVLRDDDGLRRGMNYAWSHELPPLDMWTNVRLFRATEEWSLMDTVGNGQFDLPDLEAVYTTEDFEPSDIEGFLRSASLYMLQGGEKVEDGDTAEGPGEINWMAMECIDALSDPPRPTIRWVPETDNSPPAELMDRGSLPANESDDFDEDLVTDEPIEGSPFVDPDFDDNALLDGDFDGDFDGDIDGSRDDEDLDSDGLDDDYKV
jgi:hypothetical protein